jgi:hypothetical protein
VAKLDDDIAQSLKQRSERRRQLLTALIGRIAAEDQTDLVDVLFALTSFEMFDALSVRRRSDTAIEALIQELVADSLKRSSARRRPDGAESP